jgi:murein DD-endopeptidase MepM/ murein hydrolase activator NlpD
MERGIFRAAVCVLSACWLALTVMLLATEAGSVSVSRPSSPFPPGLQRPLPPRDPADAFESFLSTDISPADGFDFPVGDPDAQGSYTDFKTGEAHSGWYVAVRFGQWYSYGIHPGEDWNGVGGTDTDLGQPVHAVAAGRVVFAGDCGQPSGGVVMIQHVYFENHEKHRIRSVYAHLKDIQVKKGDEVRRRQVIASIGQDPQKTFHAHLHLEMRRDQELGPTFWPSANHKSKDWVREHYADPSAFIRSHRNLFVPSREENLVLVDRASNRLRIYQDGRLTGQYNTHSRRLPEGMYFIAGRHGNDWSGRWLTINYPNRYDASRGREKQILTPEQEVEISRAWQDRKLSRLQTHLGRGIGVTGYLSAPPESCHACILMQDADMRDAYEKIPEGAMVVIF